MDRKIDAISVIIPHRGIGDLIFHLPLLKTLYKNYNKKIIIISNPSNKSKFLLKKEKYIKKIIYFNFNRGSALDYVNRILKLIKLINSLNTELLILTDPSKRLVIPVYLSNAKKKLCSGINSFSDFFCNKTQYRKTPLAKHLRDLMSKLKLRDFINSYKIGKYWQKRFQYRGALKKDYIFFNIDSHHNQNNWDINYFIKIIEKIKKIKIFVNTSPYNLIFFIKKINELKNKKNIIITSKFSIGKLISVISKCKIVIGNESGPICIAGSLNKKVFSIHNQNTTKPESGVISKKIQHFDTQKYENIEIINIINKNINKYYKKNISY